MAKPSKTELLRLARLTEFTKTMRLEAAARLAGSSLAGTKRNSSAGTWVSYLTDTLKKERGTSDPRLIAMSAKTGMPLTYQDVEKIKLAAKANAITNAEDVFYVSGVNALKKISAQTNLKEADIKKLYEESWSTYSGQSGSIFGTTALSALAKQIKRVNTEFTILTTKKPPPPPKLLAWIKKITKDFCRQHKVELIINGGGKLFGIVYKESTGYEELYLFKVKGPRIPYSPFKKSNDYKNFVYELNTAQDLEGPYNNILPTGASRQASAIAHWKNGEKTKDVREVVKFYDDGLTLLRSIKNTMDEAEYNETVNGITKELNNLRTLLADVQNAASVVADFTTNPSRMATTDPTFLNAKSRVKVTNNYVTVPVINNQNSIITSRDITITNTMVVSYLADDDVDKYFDSSAAFNSGAQSAFERMTASTAIDLINMSSSFSPLKFQVLRALSTILGEPKLAQAAMSKKPGSSRGKSDIIIGRKGKKVKPIEIKKSRFKNKVKSVIPKLDKPTTKGRYVTSSDNLDTTSFDQSQLLTIINANLRDAVLSNMGSSSLVNRTGVFAGSVEAVSLINNIVTTKYKREPYEVFQQEGGKFPWNAEAGRDPIAIINNAIEKISREKLNNIALINEVL